MHDNLLRLAVVASLCFSLPCAGQTTVLDGVFTDAQARRGGSLYDRHCAECHEGSEPDADPLIGPVFIERWREASLDFLYGFISTEMPGNKAGSLSEQNYLDVVAYLLSANDYPAGSALSHEQLGDILLVSPGGPRPLPLYNLVRAVGCLAHASGDEWQLDSSPPLARVRFADETNPAELALSAATAAGDGSYRLRNAADHAAEQLKGYRVQVKGVLTAHGPPASINVLSLDRVGEHCGPH